MAERVAALHLCAEEFEERYRDYKQKRIAWDKCMGYYR
jgi:hypothetical protein